jgi:hypothetical protein
MPKSYPASATPGRIVLGLCAAFVFGILVLINHQSNSRMDELFENGVNIHGQVTALVCNNHGKVHYSFSEGGKNYFGIGNCVLPCESAKIGQPVSLIYLRQHPERSSCDSKQEIETRSRGAYFMLLFAAIIISIAIYRITKIENIG